MDAAGGYIHIPEYTGEGFRMSDSIIGYVHKGETWIPASAVRAYGLDLIKRIFPNSDIHIVEVEDLLESDPSDGQVRPETPGGHP
jgi:hypothetical protein